MSWLMRKQVLANGASGNFLRIEARPGIAHDDQDAALLVASHQALNHFGGIFLGAMNHSIGQGFQQSEFDGVFLAVNAFHAAHRLHHLRHDRVHGLAISRKRDSHAQTQFFGIEVVPRELFLGRNPRFHGWSVCPLSARETRSIAILAASRKSGNDPALRPRYNSTTSAFCGVTVDACNAAVLHFLVLDVMFRRLKFKHSVLQLPAPVLRLLQSCRPSLWWHTESLRWYSGGVARG